ncbi:hypothetical protein [Ferruginibacter sp.]
MDIKKDAAEDSIVDFIEDDEYYQIKKDKQQIENATWGIYIFAIVSLLFYVVFLLINNADFNWLFFAINIILIAVYFCLAAFSNYKPYTAFIATICFLVIIFFTGCFFYIATEYKRNGYKNYFDSIYFYAAAACKKGAAL